MFDAFGTTDVPPLSAPVIARKPAGVSLALGVLYWGGPHLSGLRTDHFGARTRSAKPVSNQRRICAQKTYV